MRRTTATPAERRVAAGLRRRDPDAVRTLCREYGPSAFALLRHTLSDRGAAEDVYQQVLLEAWQRSATYDPERASLRTWLATIARSRAIDHMRHRVPEPCDPTSVRLRAREPDLDHADRMTLDELVEQLPPAEAELVRLRFQFGLTQRQIALRTGMPLGTVKSRTASALRRLRKLAEAERTPPLQDGVRCAGS